VHWKNRRKEDFEALKKKKEEEDREVFLASFKKYRQGAVTSVGYVKLPPMLGNSAELSVSTTLFSIDPLAAINYYTTKFSRQSYDAMIKYLKASKNTYHDAFVNVGTNVTVENPNPTLPSLLALSQETRMNTHFSKDGEIITAPACPSHVRSVLYSAILPNQATHPIAALLGGSTIL
jgi:hypothetical protein